MKSNVYSRITDQIVAELEKGVRPWHKPWNAGHVAGPISRPLRSCGKPYSGINVVMLWATAMERGYSAHYVPSLDYSQMPPFESFRDAAAYYVTLAHECTHWTRHEKRLDRDLGRKRFGDQGYAMEELVAELGAAFLCADLDLTPQIRDDHAPYIAGWLKVLKEDKREIFTAA